MSHAVHRNTNTKMSSFSAFFSTHEFQSIYECLFENMGTSFLAGVADLSLNQLQSLTSLLGYYDHTIRLRNSRRIPMSVSLTFESVRFFVDRHKILKTVSDPNLVATLVAGLGTSSATRVFKILNQIVDLNQKSKFALSFQHILKKLGFVENSLLAHLRNALFHQETPSERNTERALKILVREVKALFWDKNYYWLLKLTATEEDLKKKCTKFAVVPLEKVELNDVDAASDLALAEKELDNLLHQRGNSVLSKDIVGEFIKEKVKGLHRKVAVAHLAAQQLSRIAAEIVTSTSKDLDSTKQTAMSNFLQILLYLCEIFASNKNMHRVFEDRGFRTNLEHIFVMNQVLELEADLFAKVAEKSQGRIFKQLIGAATSQTTAGGNLLGKRTPADVTVTNGKSVPDSEKKKGSSNSQLASTSGNQISSTDAVFTGLDAQLEEFERDFTKLHGGVIGPRSYRTRVNSGAGQEIDCIDEEEAAFLNRLLPEETEKIGSRQASRKSSFAGVLGQPQPTDSAQGMNFESLQAQNGKTAKPKPLVIGRRLLQHFIAKEAEAARLKNAKPKTEADEKPAATRDLAYIIAHCGDL